MAIHVRGLTYAYDAGTPREHKALRGVDVHVARGSFTAVVGPVGSGKSTLVQHFNGLLRPTSGRVEVLGIDVGRASPGELRRLRQRVGIVFQYPEHQLFAETVGADVAFGPKQMGLSVEEVEARVDEALAAVGLPLELKHRSPFALSGGQRRRAAIAGVLAMGPEVLIMDEPAAGLDPRGRRDMFDLMSRWHAEGKTIVFVTHDMDAVAEWADHVIVMHRGKQVLTGPPRRVFAQASMLEAIGLDVPQVTRVLLELQRRGLPVDAHRYTVEEAVDHLASLRSIPRADGHRKDGQAACRDR